MPADTRHKGPPLVVTWARTSPTTLTAIVIDGMKGGKYDRGISQKTDMGDGDLYPTFVFNDAQVPTLSFESTNMFKGMSIDPSELGTVTYKIAGARQGITTGGGGFLYTFTNAYLASHDQNYKYRDYSTAPIAFAAISSDGSTNPMTIAAL